MRKTPVSISFKNATVGFIAFELSLFLVCYGVYRKINRSSSFRYQLYSGNMASRGILDAYYSLGEKINPRCQIRSNDQSLWLNQGKPV